jgi:hypothetical protein
MNTYIHQSMHACFPPKIVQDLYLDLKFVRNLAWKMQVVHQLLNLSQTFRQEHRLSQIRWRLRPGALALKLASAAAAAARSRRRRRRGEASKHGFLGVHQRTYGRWSAEIRDNVIKVSRLWIGTFDTALEAALAYDAVSRRLYGLNAKTNFAAGEDLPPLPPPPPPMAMRSSVTH